MYVYTMLFSVMYIILCLDTVLISSYLLSSFGGSVFIEAAKIFVKMIRKYSPLAINTEHIEHLIHLLLLVDRTVHLLLLVDRTVYLLLLVNRTVHLRLLVDRTV